MNGSSGIGGTGSSPGSRLAASRSRRGLTPARSWVLAAAMAAALPAPAVAEKTGGKSAIPVPAAPVGRDYLVGAGDVLSIQVWREPDLSGNVPVRLDGKITVSLVGDVVARGHTPEQIAADIAERLGRFVEEAHVTVAVAQANSARYYMVGQVGKAGAFPLDGHITVLQAVALAGGFQPFAKKNKMVLVRDGRGTGGSDRAVLYKVSYNKIQEGDTNQNYVLQPGDTIVVP